jgi:hypothetical protein
MRRRFTWIYRGTRHVIVVAVRAWRTVCCPFEDHECLGGMHRQRAKQRRINQTEDRTVRTDAQSESEDSDRGECRRFR